MCAATGVRRAHDLQDIRGIIHPNEFQLPCNFENIQFILTTNKHNIYIYTWSMFDSPQKSNLLLVGWLCFIAKHSRISHGILEYPNSKNQHSNPYDPCIIWYIYIHDWVIYVGHMLVNIPYMEHLGNDLYLILLERPS